MALHHNHGLIESVDYGKRPLFHTDTALPNLEFNKKERTAI